MNIRTLISEIERPEVQRLLLAGYDGPYTIGVAQHPQHPGELAVVVNVQDVHNVRAPRQIEIAGQAVQVLIKGGYKGARTLTRQAA